MPAVAQRRVKGVAGPGQGSRGRGQRSSELIPLGGKGGGKGGYGQAQNASAAVGSRGPTIVKKLGIQKSLSAPTLTQVPVPGGQAAVGGRDGRRATIQGPVDAVSDAAKARSLRRVCLETLTSPDIKQIAARYFNKEVSDKKGRIGLDDLRRVLVSLHNHLGMPSQSIKQAEQLFKRFDFNGDGSLTFDEFFELFVSALRRIAFDRTTLLNREVFVQKQPGQVWDTYKCVKKLGTGSFGAAFLAKNKRTGDERCIKQAGKSQVQLPVEEVEREIMVMTQLDHPHLVRLYEWYEGSTSIYLVMDSLDGGTLREVVLESFHAKGRPLQEDWIRTVTRQCLDGMAYCHSQRVMHKDIKDENIMLLQRDPNYEHPFAVIIDLGVSEMFCTPSSDGGTGKHFMAGTPTTMAPEVWNNSFGPKCDVWSLGCVLFELLAGDVPFCARSFDPNDWRALHKRGPDWSRIATSAGGMSLCKRMLAFEDRDRPTMAEALEHKWFMAKAGTLKAVAVEQLNRLSEFCKQSALKRSLLFEVAAGLPMKHSQRIVDFFERMDIKKGDGGISKEELSSGFAKMGLNDSNLVARTFKALDIDGDGILSFNEFAAGVLMIFEDLLRDRVRALFQRHDRNSDGFLDQNELKEFLGNAVQFASKETNKRPEEIIQELGGNGKVSYEDVSRILLPPSK